MAGDVDTGAEKQNIEQGLEGVASVEPLGGVLPQPTEVAASELESDLAGPGGAHSAIEELAEPDDPREVKLKGEESVGNEGIVGSVDDGEETDMLFAPRDANGKSVRQRISGIFNRRGATGVGEEGGDNTVKDTIDVEGEAGNTNERPGGVGKQGGEELTEDQRKFNELSGRSDLSDLEEQELAELAGKLSEDEDSLDADGGDREEEVDQLNRDAREFRFDSETKVVDGKCGFCGAPIEGDGGNCEYCGSKFTAESTTTGSEARSEYEGAPDWFKRGMEDINKRIEEMDARFEKLNKDPKTGENIDEAMKKAAADPEMVELGREFLKCLDSGEWDPDVLRRIGRKMVGDSGDEMTDEQVSQFMADVIRPDRLKWKWNKRFREQERAKKAIQKMRALEARAAMVPELTKDLREKKQDLVSEARRLESGIGFKDSRDVAEREKWYKTIMQIASINEQLIATRNAVTILKAEYFHEKAKLHDDLGMNNLWTAIVDNVQAVGYGTWANIKVGLDSAIAFGI